jgi:peptidoglycan/xylan/chitin deacetylase (PgdA/CDA1 family)
MAWAWRYSKTGSDYLKKGQTERENFPKIIRLLEKYNIPITFSTVGHLFLDKCDKVDHNWMRRIPHFDDHWKFTVGDWYDHDPHSNYEEAPEWYAPDLIRMIIDSKVNHEIGTHTFSHIDFSYKNCPAGVAEDEIKACKMAADPYDVTLKSMVFPGGTWGNIEVLKTHGIQIYRKNVEHDLAYPWRDEHGLLVTNSSGALEYNPDYGWSARYFIKRLKKFIDKAIKTNTIAHLWFHPSLDPFILKNIFPAFLEYAVERREASDLWIGTMGEIAEYINKNKIL